ncbi:MAG: DUF5063 domain-containing protein [Chloroflexi bacterium]|nr:DUF5063 domain-containing protein [Chloroflexota bacterium]
MEIDRQEIHSAALSFLELLETDVPIDLGSLELALDKLAWMAHFVGDLSEAKEHPEVPEHNYSRWRELITKRFPNLGYYNIPNSISVSIGEADIQVGDAIDDLADIASELSEVVWRWRNNSENDALWHFRFSYESHWGSHLRNLQMYLHALRSEK